jgi:hypothetical protein
MRNNIVFENGKNQLIAPNAILKATSLLYFKEALLKEQYEDCKEFIRTAKRFGAQQDEIREVIAEYVGGGKGGRRNEADRKGGGRLRF